MGPVPGLIVNRLRNANPKGAPYLFARPKGLEHALEWIWRKLDTFAGAVVIAVAGIAASQGQTFIVQYIQRLGGHLDEATAQLVNVQTGLRYKLMSEAVRKELEADAQARVDQLQSAYDAITGANIFTRPFAFFSHAEPTIVAGTWHDFVPALPFDATTITYVIMGMILGFLFYEFIKLPVLAVTHSSQRRRFKRRL